jgi:hypothetical protein
MECAQCHSDEAALTAAHKNKTSSSKQPTRLKKTAVSEDVCLSCHDTASLAAATIGSAILTDGDGTTVNPHGLPATENHVENITCSSCHKMHGETTGVADEAVKACKSCHHTGIYTCGTCHE